MIPTWQMEAYERLRTEIVRASVFDFKKAMRKSDRLGYVCDEQKALEKWFRSKWGQLLSGDNGELIIEKCRQSYKYNISRMGRKNIADDMQKQIYEEWRNGARVAAICQRYGITSTTLYDIVRRWQK